MSWQLGSAPRGSRGEHGVGTWLADEVAGLMDSADHGWGRGVGQVGLQGTPGPLPRILVGPVAVPVEQMPSGMLGELGLHRSAEADDHVVQDDSASALIREQHLPQEGTETGAGDASGHGPHPVGTADIDGPEPSAALILRQRQYSLPLPLGNPGQAYPGKQIKVTFVLGEDHCTGRDRRGRLAHLGPALLGFRITLEDRLGASPGVNLAQTPPDRSLGEAQLQGPPDQGGGPLSRLGEAAGEAAAQLQPNQPGPSRTRPVRESLLRGPLQPTLNRTETVEDHPGDLLARACRHRQTDHEEAKDHRPIVREGGDQPGVGRALGRGQWKTHTGCVLPEMLADIGSCKATQSLAVGASRTASRFLDIAGSTRRIWGQGGTASRSGREIIHDTY